MHENVLVSMLPTWQSNKTLARCYNIFSSWDSQTCIGTALWSMYLQIRNGVYTMTTKVMNITWWRHQMETFSALLAIYAGNSPVSGEFPAQMPVTFDLCLNKYLSERWWGWWFETPSCSLWRHCNEYWKFDNHWQICSSIYHVLHQRLHGIVSCTNH